MDHTAYIWSLFFASLASIGRHPGFWKPGCSPPSLQDCAAEADEMLAIYQLRFPEEK